MSEIRIESVTAQGSTIRSSISYTRDLRRFFDDEPFFVEYDTSVTDVPSGILSIPVLAHICPVAWANGADVIVPVVDQQFLESLRAVRAVLSDMYPSLMEGGSIIAEEVTDMPSTSDENSHVGMLFTGGVDSLSTYVRHHDEDPTLINVQGWVINIDEDERWRFVQEKIDEYGDRFDVDTRFIRSNMLRFLDTAVLSAEFDRYHDGEWYNAVGCGIGLPGLCAPLAVKENMSRIYIGATFWENIRVPDGLDHWEGEAMPWGSHPRIDNNVAWGKTSVDHVGFDLNRQERIETIAEYVRDDDPDLPIRSCSNSAVAENCSRCEKCIRTALGLALAGLDPNRHGFDVDRRAFDHAIEQFEAGRWLSAEHSPYYWHYFQDDVSPDQELPLDGAEQFLEWLQTADFESMTGESTGVRARKSLIRHTPYPVFSTVRHLYRSLRSQPKGESGPHR